jgi:diacylglycerol kinase (ATP)
MISAEPGESMVKGEIVIVFNPNAGRHRAERYFKEVSELLIADFEVTGLTGEKFAKIEGNLKELYPEVRLVIAIGGDGLVNLVMQKMVFTGVPLFVFPAGTGNDFFRSNFERNAMKQLALNLSSLSSREIDTVSVEIGGSTRYFGQILSAGFDSFVNARANNMSYLPGKIKYIVCFFLEIFSFKPNQYQITMDGKTFAKKAMMLVVANGPTYGGGMKVIPFASPSDGVLDVLILNPVSKLELLRVFPKVFAGRHINHRAVELFKCREISVFSAPPIYADGEYFGHGKFTCKVEAENLSILVST